MLDTFEITGKFMKENDIIGSLSLSDIKLYINIPEWIEERNVYSIDTKKLIGTIKPRKFNGLTYYIYDVVDEYAKIKTITYGFCLVRITEATTLTNKPLYENGGY